MLGNRARDRTRDRNGSRAPLSSASGAWLADLAAYLAVCAAAAWKTGALPLPSSLGLTGGALAVCGFVALWAAQEALFGATFGQRIWGLGRSGAPLFSALERRRKAGVATATLLTLGLAGGASAGLSILLLRHPVLARSEPWKLDARFPSANEARDWLVSPYYYAIGAWPRRFGGQPVMHALPYEKGPPAQFIGRVVARWELPSVRTTFEGPKTPEPAPAPDRLRSCLERGWERTIGTDCLSIREGSLGRHVREMRRVSPSRWELRWFEVKNPAIPPDERPRGFYLAARGEARSEERFVLVNARGTQQAFILERPSYGDAAERATLAFERAIRSQRVAPTLDAGRAWVDRELESTRLSELVSIRDPDEFASRMSDLLSLLVSKASVDPRGVAAYFHLAGSALLLARRGASDRRPEWGAVARPLVLAAWRYAQDVAPSDPRTAQLEQLWLEARKL